MTVRGITFDFHNTIASCDAWFQLEVRRLVSAFLEWDARSRGTTHESTLSEAADAAYRGLRQAIHVHGHELPAERCVAMVLDRLGVRVEPSEIARGIDELMRAVVPSATPMIGALETVRRLAGDGVALGVVSSAVHHPFLEWTLERFGVREAFEVVTTSASAGYYKSRPEIYWQTLQQLGADATGSVHVGDSWRFDVVGARRAGMRTVLIAEQQDPSAWEGILPDLVLSSLENAAPRVMDVLTAP